MPRLIGKQSNRGLYTGLILAFAIVAGAASSLEYFGFINVIPGFGRDHRPSDRPGDDSGLIFRR